MTGRLAGLAVLLGAGLAWETAARAGLFPPKLLPPLTVVLDRLLTLGLDGTLPLALARTVARAAAGLGLAAAIMIPLGLAAGSSERVRRLLAPVVELLRPLPPALVILPAMLFLGIGDALQVFVVFFAAAFPILLNTVAGVRAVPALFLDTAKTLGLGRTATALGIIAPAALPGMFTGLKTALPIALIVAIVSEMIGSTDGVGHFILKSQRTFRIPETYAAVLATGLVGWALASALERLERRCLDWYFRWKRGTAHSNSTPAGPR